MSTANRIHTFLAARLAAGESAVLVTVTDVTGASVRNPGAQMAVAANGEHAGSLSGGCIERAVAAEAMDVLRAGAPRRIAYGAGSPIIDIRLPCGGRVDLLFTPLRDSALPDLVLAGHRARRAGTIALPAGPGEPGPGEAMATGWAQDESRFHVRMVPPLRLVIAGHGGAVEALVALAGAMDIDCHVLSPDPAIIARLENRAVAATLLDTPRETRAIAGDAWSATVFLFHDHDWEAALIGAALAGPGLYVGAMGSRRTHAARIEGLRAAGIAEADLARIVSPIGLIPSSRDPETLALSILAEVVSTFNAAKARAEAGEPAHGEGVA